MADVLIKRCDHCGNTISDGAKRFDLRAVVVVVNGHETDHTKNAECCSSQCLLNAMHALARTATEDPK